MTTYEIIEFPYSSNPTIKRTGSDGSVCFIPMNESNSDYQAYLRWLENPNADEDSIIS